MRIVAAIGAASTIPIGPHSRPQKARASRIVTGWGLSPSPMIFGSITFPTAICTAPGTATTASTVQKLSNWATATGIGSSVAITEPTEGMKFRRNASMPNIEAIFRPNIRRMTQTRIPVIAESTNFVEM